MTTPALSNVPIPDACPKCGSPVRGYRELALNAQDVVIIPLQCYPNAHHVGVVTEVLRPPVVIRGAYEPRPCQHCRKPFTAMALRRYCSDACRDTVNAAKARARRAFTAVEAACQKCSAPFTRQHPSSRLCEACKALPMCRACRSKHAGLCGLARVSLGGQWKHAGDGIEWKRRTPTPMQRAWVTEGNRENIARASR